MKSFIIFLCNSVGIMLYNKKFGIDDRHVGSCAEIRYYKKQISATVCSVKYLNFDPKTIILFYKNWQL